MLISIDQPGPSGNGTATHLRRSLNGVILSEISPSATFRGTILERLWLGPSLTVVAMRIHGPLTLLMRRRSVRRLAAARIFGGALCLATLSLAMPKAIYAEDEAARFPADGTWVRYLIESDAKVPSAKKVDVEATMTITLSLVGTVTEEGLTCRWLESKRETRKGPVTEEKLVQKVLVPDVDLFESSKPFESMRRMWGWSSRSNEPPVMTPASPNF